MKHSDALIWCLNPRPYSRNEIIAYFLVNVPILTSQLQCCVYFFCYISAVGSDYEVMANASSYNVTITADRTSGSINIPFTVIIDRFHFGANFPSTSDQDAIVMILTFSGSLGVGTGRFNLNGADMSGFKIYYNPPDIPLLSEITLLDNTARGSIMVLRDQVDFTYSLDAPLLQPSSMTFFLAIDINSQSGTSFSRTPFINGTVELVPPGKCLVIYDIVAIMLPCMTMSPGQNSFFDHFLDIKFILASPTIS